MILLRWPGADNGQGDCDDEGTLFSVASYNLTTNKEALAYIQSNYLLGSTDAEIATLALHYPQDPTQGSPFDTGSQSLR